ncbi:hypothetical protein LJY25_20410 [Hymenobacter sp. BT175]|uniref:hypothetical protein n=1 Tax=Hymenobacter translucens TaxID=2886507 RepID=UPI001D0ED959|nr:hypothetical protein [Hymenobacter translucens]MCC2548824.1 hypothetical protein [Hymenobacter translucens]
MKNLRLYLLPFLLILLTFSVSSCDVVGGIFKAGAYTALIGVFVLVLLLYFLVRKMRR